MSCRITCHSVRLEARRHWKTAIRSDWRDIAGNGGEILIYGYYSIKLGGRRGFKCKLYTTLLLSRYLLKFFSLFVKRAIFLVSFILRIATKRFLLSRRRLQADKLSRRDALESLYSIHWFMITHLALCCILYHPCNERSYISCAMRLGVKGFPPRRESTGVCCALFKVNFSRRQQLSRSPSAK